MFVCFVSLVTETLIYTGIGPWLLTRSTDPAVGYLRPILSSIGGVLTYDKVETSVGMS